jgi:hypothetical protein
VYGDKTQATRAFVDQIYLHTLKGGGATALKYLTFTGIMIGTSLVIQAYRNKSTPFDFTLGGGLFIIGRFFLKKHF